MTELFGLSCVQNDNQRLYEDMILIDDDDSCCDLYIYKLPLYRLNIY